MTGGTGIIRALPKLRFVVLLGQRCFAHPVHAGMHDIVSLYAVNKVKALFISSVPQVEKGFRGAHKK